MKTWLTKFQKAVKGKMDSKDVYDELTLSLDETLITEWKVQEGKAMKDRGVAMKIFAVQEEKGAICV